MSVLEAMAKHKDQIDIQQGGEHGRTALHIAAIYDHDACARILVSRLKSWFHFNYTRFLFTHIEHRAKFVPFLIR